MVDTTLQIRTLTARWIIPVSSPPLEWGTVSIAGDRLIAVDPPGTRSPDLDLGEAVVMPGLSNAHTHLDLSDLRGEIKPTADFTAWLRAVIERRRARSGEENENAIRAGLEESLAFGTTLLGDISGGGASWAALAAAPLRAVVFRELLGLPRARAREAWAEAAAWMNGLTAAPNCRPGLSPHAPYSVRASLFRLAARAAVVRELPLAIHLAETPMELQLLGEHAGPFVDFLGALGVWDPGGLVRSVEQLLQMHVTLTNVLLVHGNYLSSNSSVPRGSSIIYCPRTHAAFGHRSHPASSLLASGCRIALGTDSLASNPDLSVLEEARHMHRQDSGIPAEAIIRMATLSGAEALGWSRETSSLTPGKSADLIVVPLDPGHGDPHERLLRSDAQVCAVMFRGRWVQGCAE
jgi:cytosine/adenosine deaminase-related metal-dependent hydrolase